MNELHIRTALTDIGLDADSKNQREAPSASAEPGYALAVGRAETTHALISAEQVRALAAAVDLDAIPGGDENLPAGWHWLFFNPFVRRSELGADGHPKRGGFLPDVSLARRMWAGGRLTYHAPLRIGASTVRESEIVKVTSKTGGMGKLVFVTVRHLITHNGTLCIEEEQDIVYCERPALGGNPKLEWASQEAKWSELVTPDPVLLFRYSALTSNGHRIHYDQPYARDEEGYRDLVVHGPLIATLLQGFAARCRPDRRLVRFDFRAKAPLFVDRGFWLEASPGECQDDLILWARGSEGELAMQAEAVFGA